MRISPSPIVLALLSLACLEPPELDALAPPSGDFEDGVDTWPDLDGEGDGSAEDGASDADGGADGSPDAGGADGDDELDPGLAQLRIVEVLANPDGADGVIGSPEFVEVLNPGPGSVALAGLELRAESWPVIRADELGLAGASLEAGGLLVVQRWTPSESVPESATGVDGAVIWAGLQSSSGLRNADGRIELSMGSTTIDELAYGAGASPGSGWSGDPSVAGGSGESLCRLDPVDNDDASDWGGCQPSPGVSDSELPGGGDGDGQGGAPVQPGTLVIMEVSANPPGPSNEEKAYEYIEIQNISDVDIDLSGCKIGDAPQFDAPGVDPLAYLEGEGGCAPQTCLAPGRRALLVGQGYLGEVGAALVLSTDDTTLADGGLTNTEPALLWNSEGTLLSSYRLWPDPSVEPLPSDEQPIHRLESDAQDTPGGWVSALASPGEA